MTTRAQLESEREALRGLRDFAISKYARGQSDDENYDPRIWPWDESEVEALTASIARVEALLSLTDAQCAAFCRHMESVIREIGVVARLGDPHGLRPLPPADGPHRIITNLIRREPRGDV